MLFGLGGIIRDSKSGERGEHARAIFFGPAELIFWSVYAQRMCIGAYFGCSCANVWAISTAVLSFRQIA